MDRLNGFDVVLSSYGFTRPWVFPAHPFFEWEKKDEHSCRVLGIGHEGLPEPACYQVGNTLVMHPEVWAKVKNEIGQRERQVRAVMLSPI